MAKKRKGRKSGVPNLVRTDSGFRNQWGVEFTAAEKRKLEYGVNSANRKRKRQLAKAAQMPRYAGGKATEGTALDLMLMGKESDLIITQKSKSLQRFRTREQFDKYLDMLQRVNDPGYVRKRMQLYKRNYMQAIKSEFGGAGSDIYMKVRMMPLEQFMENVYGRDELEIHFIYGAEEGRARREQIRASLGMKSKE